MSATTLDLVEKALDLGTAEVVLALAEPGGAEQMAARVMAGDPCAAAEFGDPALLAAYLRSRARPQRLDAERALREPGQAPRLSMIPTAAAAMHHLQATAPKRPAPPAPAAAAAPAPVALSAPPAQPTPSRANAAAAPPVRLSIGDAARRAGMRFDALPRTEPTRKVLAELGLLAVPNDAKSWDLDAAALDRTLADPDATSRLVCRLAHAVPALGQVGGGSAVAVL